MRNGTKDGVVNDSSSVLNVGANISATSNCLVLHCLQESRVEYIYTSVEVVGTLSLNENGTPHYI